MPSGTSARSCARCRSPGCRRRRSGWIRRRRIAALARAAVGDGPPRVRHDRVQAPGPAVRRRTHRDRGAAAPDRRPGMAEARRAAGAVRRALRSPGRRRSAGPGQAPHHRASRGLRRQRAPPAGLDRRADWLAAAARRPDTRRGRPLRLRPRRSTGRGPPGSGGRSVWPERDPRRHARGRRRPLLDSAGRRSTRPCCRCRACHRSRSSSTRPPTRSWRSRRSDRADGIRCLSAASAMRGSSGRSNRTRPVAGGSATRLERCYRRPFSTTLAATRHERAGVQCAAWQCGSVE